MASAYLVNLYSIRDKLTAQIEGMLDDVTNAGGHPTTTGPTTTQHIEFWNSRWKALELLNEQIDEVEAAEGVEVFEVTSEMVSW